MVEHRGLEQSLRVARACVRRVEDAPQIFLNTCHWHVFLTENPGYVSKSVSEPNLSSQLSRRQFVLQVGSVQLAYVSKSVSDFPLTRLFRQTFSRKKLPRDRMRE